MQRDDLLGELTGALDPLLGAVGFAKAQGGLMPDGTTDLLWCAGHDDLSERCPWLPQAWEHERGTTACIDLSVRFDVSGRLVAADLEGLPLESTLRELGLEGEAAAVESRPEGGAAVATLADVLDRLLNRP